jgi:hypothetical protein
MGMNLSGVKVFQSGNPQPVLVWTSGTGDWDQRQISLTGGNPPNLATGGVYTLDTGQPHGNVTAMFVRREGNILHFELYG